MSKNNLLAALCFVISIGVIAILSLSVYWVHWVADWELRYHNLEVCIECGHSWECIEYWSTKPQGTWITRDHFKHWRFRCSRCGAIRVAAEERLTSADRSLIDAKFNQLPALIPTPNSDDSLETLWNHQPYQPYQP